MSITRSIAMLAHDKHSTQTPSFVPTDPNPPTSPMRRPPSSMAQPITLLSAGRVPNQDPLPCPPARPMPSCIRARHASVHRLTPSSSGCLIECAQLIALIDDPPNTLAARIGIALIPIQSNPSLALTRVDSSTRPVPSPFPRRSLASPGLCSIPSLTRHGCPCCPPSAARAESISRPTLPASCIPSLARATPIAAPLPTSSPRA